MNNLRKIIIKNDKIEKIMYNVLVDPVIICNVPKVFLLQKRDPRGAFCHPFCNPLDYIIGWVNQSVPFGFFI